MATGEMRWLSTGPQPSNAAVLLAVMSAVREHGLNKTSIQVTTHEVKVNGVPKMVGDICYFHDERRHTPPGGLHRGSSPP